MFIPGSPRYSPQERLPPAGPDFLPLCFNSTLRRDQLKTALDILPEPAKVGPKEEDFAAKYAGIALRLNRISIDAECAT
jgi:hypothetical protein